VSNPAALGSTPRSSCAGAAEGRVDRYASLAIRRAIAKDAGNEVAQGSLKASPWEHCKARGRRDYRPQRTSAMVDLSVCTSAALAV
jgi:hypothetical protein